MASIKTLNRIAAIEAKYAKMKRRFGTECTENTVSISKDGFRPRANKAYYKAGLECSYKVCVGTYLAAEGGSVILTAEMHYISGNKGYYFSLTHDGNGSSGATCPELIAQCAEHRPDTEEGAKAYRMLILCQRLHLANCKTGLPMHGKPNSEYFLFNEGYRKIGDFASVWGLTVTEAEKLTQGITGPGEAFDKLISMLTERNKRMADELYMLMCELPEFILFDRNI